MSAQASRHVEEDLDDLDDVLDQFDSSHKPSPPALSAKSRSPPGAISTPSPTTFFPSTGALDSTKSPQIPPVPPPTSTFPSSPLTGGSAPSSSALPGAAGLDGGLPGGGGIDAAFSDAFASEFAKNIESMMKEFGGSFTGEQGPGQVGGAGGAGGEEEIGEEEEKRREEMFKKAWDDMMKDGMEEAMTGLKLDPTAEGSATGAGASGQGEDRQTRTLPEGADVEDKFLKSVRQAQEKLKESEANLRASESTSMPDDLEKLIAQLGSGEADEEFSGILEGMMGSLMSKDILYEPLKELNDKFPPYLSENKDKLSTEDKERFVAQQECITKIVAIFEDVKYSDEDVEKKTEVMQLMTEMQSHGSPPAEIMGPLPPGLDMGADGMPELPDGCTIS